MPELPINTSLNALLMEFQFRHSFYAVILVVVGFKRDLATVITLQKTKHITYVFHAHLLTSACGVIWDIIRLIQGIMIGNKGYISATLHQELACYGIDLQTALRSNIQDSRPKHWVKLLQTVRQRIETNWTTSR